VQAKVTVCEVDMAGGAVTGGDPVPPVRGGVVSRRGLFGRLGAAGRVTEVSAPAGSGKTLLLRSWIAEAGLDDAAAWVSVQPQERDAQRFWLSVLDALRATAAGSALVRELTAAPDLDTGDIVEGLLQDLGALQDPIWLVIDDVHELRSTDALRQLELLLMLAPAALRFVLVTRQDLRLGLHRLRLEGGLTEIRAADLRFTLAEARALFEAAGVQLPGPVLELLVERTEGWAAGLRLAALSLPGHPAPEQFAAEFSGSERTVAEYLLAEVLERQSEEVRRLLLRTSVLERVSGELADLLTGGSGGERVLHELERAGAFVVSLDARRQWFRYHPLFAELLRLELRSAEPGGLPALHAAAAGWFAGHGYPVEAVRHAQEAEDWAMAARLLSDTWLSLTLDGQQDTAHQLLTRFPAEAAAADPELIALVAADELNRGSLEEAEAHLAQATRELGSVPAERRGRLQVSLGILRLLLARQRGDVPAVAEEAQRLLAQAGTADGAELGMGEERRALALISLGEAETWTFRNEEAERHLEQGVALARQIGRPYLELTGLCYITQIAVIHSFTLGAQRCMEAIELAGRHGWGKQPITGVAYVQLAGAMVGQGRLEEAERWLELAERALRVEIEPIAGITLYWMRGALQLSRGCPERALDAFPGAERLAEGLRTPLVPTAWMRSHALQVLVRLGQTERVEAALGEMNDQERDPAFMRAVTAVLRLASDDPQAATVALEPAIAGSAPPGTPILQVEALLLEAVARGVLGDRAAAQHALERALDLAEPDRLLMPFLFHPAPDLLKRQARHGTAHGALITHILSLLAGTSPAGAVGLAAPPGRTRSLREPLSQAETRVLRYLPTGLTMPEIAEQLYLSANTVRTHLRHIYQKLGAHHRGEAVDRARALGLLAPSPRNLSNSRPGALQQTPAPKVVQQGQGRPDEQHGDGEQDDQRVEGGLRGARAGQGHCGAGQ
jgi:LuxR family transcriptional regulator, maltose regulon positive regulatory protein